MISLDNNAAERALRRPIVTRKNAYRSRNEDAARLAARIWTITATAEMAGLNVLTYLTAYLDTCGRTNGKPPTGPTWNGSCPGPRPAKTCTPGHSHLAPVDTPANPVTASPLRNGHAAPRHASTGLPNTYPGPRGPGRLRPLLRLRADERPSWEPGIDPLGAQSGRGCSGRCIALSLPVLTPSHKRGSR